MRLHWLAAAGLSIAAAVAGAKLPPPTPAEQEAAAAKKAKDAEQLKQAQEALTRVQDQIAARYRRTHAGTGGGQPGAGPTEQAHLPKTVKEGLTKDDAEKLAASLKEQGINVELGNWRGVFGAPGLTPQQRDGLVKLVKDATETPAWKGSLEKYGWTSFYLGGEEFKKYLDEDIKRTTVIIESLGIKK